MCSVHGVFARLSFILVVVLQPMHTIQSMIEKSFVQLVYQQTRLISQST